MPPFLLYGLAVYVLLLLVPYVLVFHRLVSLAFQHPQHTLQPEAAVPNYIKQLFQPAQAELERLGFQFRCYVESEDIVGTRRWSAHLTGADNHTVAVIGVSALPDPANPVSLTFYTFLVGSEGRDLLVMTLNGLAHGIIGQIPDAIVVDPYVLDTELHWQAHTTKLKELADLPLVAIASPQQFIDTFQAHESAYVDSLIRNKTLIHLQGTSYLSLRLGPALQAAVQVGRGNNRRMALLKRRSTRLTANLKEGTMPLIPIPVEAEVQAYQDLRRFEEGRSRRSANLVILLVSLIVSVLSFTHLFNGRDLLILVGVLFLHELGHFLAMRLFGYQNTSIFFLPFFGAAAAGRKDHATLTEKVIVLLAGPLPGLLLGCAIALLSSRAAAPFTPSHFVTIGFLIGLNYLNLLPIFPLDGGRIIHLLLFSRLPWAELIFKGVMVGLLGWLALSTWDPFLSLIGFAVAASLPASYRSARILGLLRRSPHLATADVKTLLHTIFTAMQQVGYQTIPFLQKYNLAKAIVQLYQEPPASWQTRLLLLGSYLICLVGGLILAIFSFVTHLNYV